MKKKFFLLSWVLLFSAAASFAGVSGAAPSANAPVPADSQINRKTSLSFDNDVVEGMNGGGLDSAENIGAEDGSKQHLYHKRMNFKKETPVLIREMGFSE